jgi:hypothetical protein
MDDDSFTAKPASALRVGDLIDLQGDVFADPSHENRYFASAWQTVATIEPEGDGCVAVGIEGFDVVGFPSGHYVRVRNPTDG